MIKKQWNHFFNKKKSATTQEIPGFKSKQTKKRTLLYSNDFKTFVRQHKGVLSRAFALLKELEKSEKTKISDLKYEISIEKGKATGHYLGKNPQKLFKIELGNKAFFVKKHLAYSSRIAIERFNLIEKKMDKINHQINGINIQLIKPHLIYNKWLVTDFYDKSEVIQLNWWSTNVPNKIELAQPKLFRVLQRIENQLINYHLGALDSVEVNRFYNAKTNTILLFDYL